MELVPLPALTDNYIWLLRSGQHALVVDPGDAAPVLATLAREGILLSSILVTHHHADHVGGVAALRAATGAAVYGPAHPDVPEPCTRVVDGQQIELLGLQWHVLAVPGHTLTHLAYYAAPVDAAPLLFCGDTLFSGGCGRLFEGTPAQMLASLERLAALPPQTRVCCAHEYTLANLRFAHVVEPANPDLAAYAAHCSALRARGEPTLPSTLALEARINPFLRSRTATVVRALQSRDPSAQSAAARFGALRAWKDHFQ